MGGDNNPSDIHGLNTNTISRRNLIKKLSALGFSAPVATSLTAEDVDAADSDQVPIDETLGPDSSVRMVPSDWYDRLKHAERVSERNNYLNREGAIAQSVIPGRFGGDNPHITITINDKGQKGDYPERKDGVRIDVVEGEMRDLDSPCGTVYQETNISPTDEIRGGVYMETEGRGGSYGTLGGRLVHKSDMGKTDEWFLTCRHIFSGCNWSEVNDTYAYQPETFNDQIGYVDDGSYTDDWVAIRRNSIAYSPSPNQRDRPSKTDNVHIDGSYTKDGIASHGADGGRFYKIGARTCKTDGSLWSHQDQLIRNYGPCDSDASYQMKGQVRWGSGSDAGGGDSGALVYAPASGGDINAVSVHAGGYFTLQNGETQHGTGIYRIYNQKGYLVGDYNN